MCDLIWAVLISPMETGGTGGRKIPGQGLSFSLAQIEKGVNQTDRLLHDYLPTDTEAVIFRIVIVTSL